MSKFWAHGTTVSIDGTDIGGRVNISLPSQTRGEVDISDGDSSGVSEFIPGILDNGSVELEMRYDPEDAGQQALESNMGTATNVEFIITLPATAASTSPVTLTFDGYCSALGGDLPQTGNEAGTRTATIRVSGAITISLGT